MIKFLALLVVLFIQSLSQTAWSQIKVIESKITPPSLFTFEDRAVTFSVKLKNNREDLLLVSLIDDKNFDLYKWDLNDNGVLGDKKKGDSFYSRKIQFKEKKPGIKKFAVITKDEQNLKKIEDPNRVLELEIIKRPSFLELVKGAFQKILKHF